MSGFGAPSRTATPIPVRAMSVRVPGTTAPWRAVSSIAASLMMTTSAGEPVDVVIMSDAAIDETARQGAVVPGTRTDIARTGMGVAVREGAPKPDISTPEALKQALLAAKSLVYVDPGQGATSGIHFAGVLERLGIADAVRAKTRLVPGGYPAELVARGEVELVAHQIREIVPVKGVTLVGELLKGVGGAQHRRVLPVSADQHHSDRQS